VTKFFIAIIVGGGLMIPMQASADTINNNSNGVKKESKKDVHHKKLHAKKSTAKKAKYKKAALATPKPVERKVVTLDFDKSPTLNKKVQLVSAKDFPKREFHPSNRAPASQPHPMTVEQLKASTKPYWAAYCKDGIVLNSHVYCALKNPQKMGMKLKTTKMASSHDLEAKKRK